MDLIFSPDALRQLLSIPGADAKRISRALQQVAEAHPTRMSFVTELVGEPGNWRLRKGDYRALYRLTETEMIVYRIGHRRDVYE
jgi:mRNA interferase RelE/StbE